MKDFVKNYLYERVGKNQGQMATLRHSLHRDKFAIGVYSILPIHGETKPHVENAMKLVAGMYAIHPGVSVEDHHNFGKSFRALYQRMGENPSMEKRFERLLECKSDDLPKYMRSIIKMMKSQNVAINYEKLYTDLMYWDYGRTKREWAIGFWGGLRDNEQNNEGENKEKEI